MAHGRAKSWCYHRIDGEIQTAQGQTWPQGRSAGRSSLRRGDPRRHGTARDRAVSDAEVLGATIMRIDNRAPDAMRPAEIVSGYLLTAEGSVLMKLGHTQVLCAASVERRRAAVSAQQRQGLGDGRVFHAAAGHRQAHAARGGQGPALRQDARNPAPDRPLAARRGGHGGARRAHRDARLRRAAGRWRHAHGLHHGGLRGAGAGAAPLWSNSASSSRCRCAITWPPPAWAWSAASRCSTSATRRIRRPTSI
jgi:hypothetical protein